MKCCQRVNFSLFSWGSGRPSATQNSSTLKHHNPRWGTVDYGEEVAFFRRAAIPPDEIAIWAADEGLDAIALLAILEAVGGVA